MAQYHWLKWTVRMIQQYACRQTRGGHVIILALDQIPSWVPRHLILTSTDFCFSTTILEKVSTVGGSMTAQCISFSI